MIQFTQGNLLDAQVEAIVNTVNTVGVMGKGIALMFKERFPENYKAYVAACASGEVEVGKIFLWTAKELYGPRWIINFPTKKHWRQPARIEWIRSGLKALKKEILQHHIQSIAIPPLGCGNGGLEWKIVRPLIENELGDLPGISIIVYEPTTHYHNTPKQSGVQALTPARALIAEMIRRYWILDIGCTLIEAHKLAWFLRRTIQQMRIPDPLHLHFTPDRYGPYANQLRHLIDNMDGSYLHCAKRLADANALDIIWFDETKRDELENYLHSQEMSVYLPAIEATDMLIDGFQSPIGMEVLATVDWLIEREGIEPTMEEIKRGIEQWPAGKQYADRKKKLFNDQLLELALRRLHTHHAGYQIKE